MATFDASPARAVALELQNKALTLYLTILPIFRATAQWTLNGLDADLPTPFDLKVQLDAYKSLSLETLKLEWVEHLRKATTADTLTYPAPPEGSGLVVFDETLVFSDALIF